MIVSLFAVNCDCNPRVKGKEFNGDTNAEFIMHKQAEFIMNKLRLNKLNELKKSNHKPTKKNQPIGNDLLTQQKEFQKKTSLNSLVKDEKDLADKAKDTRKQLENELKLLNISPQEGSFSSPIPFDNEFMDKLVTDCKDDPEYTDAVVETLEKIQTCLGKFQQELPALPTGKPSIKNFLLPC